MGPMECFCDGEHGEESRKTPSLEIAARAQDGCAGTIRGPVLAREERQGAGLSGHKPDTATLDHSQGLADAQTDPGECGGDRSL